MKVLLQRLLLLLGALLLGLGLLAGVVNREVLDGDRFAQHVDSMRTDPEVARHLGALVSDQVLNVAPELVGVRPLLESVSTSLVSSQALGGVVRSALSPLHDALVSGNGDHLVLRLADTGALLVAALNTLVPNAAGSIPDNLDVQLASIGSGEATADVVAVTHYVGVLSWLLPLLGLLLLIGAALWRERGVRSVLSALSRALLGIAVAISVFVLVTQIVVGRVHTESLGSALMVAGWGELENSLWGAALVTAVLGVLLFLAGRPELRISRGSIVADATAWLAGRSETTYARVTRALIFLGVAALLIFEPVASLKTVAVGVGIVVAMLALHELFGLATDALEFRSPRLFAKLTTTLASGAAIALTVAVLAGVVISGALPGSSTLPTLPVLAQSSTTACNGHDELCDRRYTDVSFAATHNSMSAADGAGWFLAEQPTGVIGQLDDGIRVFLIDSWPGQATENQSIIANTEASRERGMAQAREEFGGSVVDSALRLREALNLTPRGPVRPYLCHALCELGSTEWTPLMRQVNAWMEAHPREVVTFFIQDEVSPQATAKVFEDAGLLPYLYTPTKGKPWPTLGEMIDTGQRLVVLHEHVVDEKSYPWLLDGTTWSQDTPYDAKRVSQFSCERLRGAKDAPLFLINHWLNNPAQRLADARKVNASAVLGRRAEQCRTERGQQPNYVAVNYYNVGDLFNVVDLLNGVN